MDVSLLISILLLVGGTLLLIFYPLWQQTRSQAILSVNPAGQTLEEYQARYQALLDAIKDLMFDHEMGKVSTEDYEILLHKTKLEAAQVRQQIDRLSEAPEDSPVEATLDAEIEALIAKLRSNTAAKNKSLIQEVNAEIELLKNVQPDGTSPGLSCPACGNRVQPDDAFCSRCGQPVEPKAELAPNTCPQCGYTFQPDDAFCARCGAALEQTVQTPSYEDAKI